MNDKFIESEKNGLYFLYGIIEVYGLDFEHAKLIAKLPYLKEVNIGHFLICDALNGGLRSSVRKMKRILNTHS